METHMIFTNISLKKLVDNPTVDSKQPSHAIIASTSDFKEKIIAGKLWMREGEWGKYLSGSLNKENRKFQKKDGTEGTELGYVIISRDEYNRLVSPSVPTGGFNGEVAYVSNIDF